MISTNGFFTDRIVELAKEFPHIGIRISIEGLEQTNNEIRGLENGYQRGYQTLKKLREMGMKDVGFGMTFRIRMHVILFRCITYQMRWGWSLLQHHFIIRFISWKQRTLSKTDLWLQRILKILLMSY